MTNIQWSDSYVVGHTLLDEEHREIMLAINRLADAGTDPLRLEPPLRALRQRVAAHFENESRILRELVAATSTGRASQKFLAAMSQALIDEHLVAHKSALVSLDSIMISALLADKAQPQRPVYEALAQWFVHHAARHDSHLKTLFQTVREDCPELLARTA